MTIRLLVIFILTFFVKSNDSLFSQSNSPKIYSSSNKRVFIESDPLNHFINYEDSKLCEKFKEYSWIGSNQKANDGMIKWCLKENNIYTVSYINLTEFNSVAFLKINIDTLLLFNKKVDGMKYVNSGMTSVNDFILDISQRTVLTGAREKIYYDLIYNNSLELLVKSSLSDTIYHYSWKGKELLIKNRKKGEQVGQWEILNKIFLPDLTRNFLAFAGSKSYYLFSEGGFLYELCKNGDIKKELVPYKSFDDVRFIINQDAEELKVYFNENARKIQLLENLSPDMKLKLSSK